MLRKLNFTERLKIPASAVRIELRRADVYICNVVKCRPPGNRDPSPEEKAACEPFLLRQLELVHVDDVVASFVREMDEP